MLQYFKDAFTTYEHAQTLQTISLVMFVVFFVALIYFIWNRPKEYYENESELPLDDEQDKY